MNRNMIGKNRAKLLKLSRSAFIITFPWCSSWVMMSWIPVYFIISSTAAICGSIFSGLSTLNSNWL